jgi:hypothetical protein
MAVVSKEYELKISTADAQKNIDELNKSFAASEDLIIDLQQDLNKYNKELDKTTGNSGRAMQKRSSLNKKIKETKAAIQEEKTALKQINSERKKNTKVIQDNTKSTKDYSGVVGILDQQTGGLISGTKNLTGSLAGATKGFNLMRVAIIATGIGALVLGIIALGKAFTSSEEGQNKFAKIMTRISVITGNVSDVLARIGKTLMSVGKVIGTVLTGDFKNLGGAIDELKNNFSEVTEKVKNFGEETRKELQLANQIADERARADKLDRQLLLDRAEATRKFNELREKAADKENVSIEDRIAALKEAGRIEDEITKKEIEAARIRFETKQLENSLSDSTKEDLDEEAQLQARLIDLESSRLKKQKTLTAEITTNLREAESERKRIAAEGKADIKKAEADEIAAAKKLADTKKLIRDATAISDAEKRELELIKIDEQFEKLKLQAEEQDLETTEIENARLAKRAEKQKEFRDKDIAAAKAAANEKKAVQMAEYEAEKQIQGQKFALLSQFGGFLSSIAGENKKLAIAGVIAQQAGAIGQIVASTGIANAKAVAATPITFGQPFVTINTISAALSIASAAASAAKSIQQIKSSGQSANAMSAPSLPTGRGGGGSNAASIASNPPSINTVGAGGVNQLASAIGESDSQPVQAFVVSNDVTTAQGLERNIIDGASI